jgi:HD-GYP domain-containing protein (c-di-GMP phosphodiesterase class II)
VARVFALANPSLEPDVAIARLGDAAPDERMAWATEACGGARMLAAAMGFDATVAGALDEVFERYDGRGVPRALEAEAISLCGRISTVAHVTLSFHTLRGAAAAREVLDAGPRACDPSLVRVAREVLDEHPDALLAGADDRLAAVAPELERQAPQAEVLRIAEAFGDFADLQSQHTRGHARGVAAIVAEGAAVLGLTAGEHTAVVLAAHLHDVGAAAVPTRIWETRDRWSEGARERARMHVYYTERALVLAAPFARAAAIAGAHHERLDAHGYHRGLGAERIPVTARLLAAADVFHALREDRPHRAAMTKTEAKDVMAGLAKEGALDPRVVDAILGSPGRVRANDSLAKLTGREREVLRFVALGRTNKEIAVALGISDRTVQSHTLNVYEKLGVDTRAAAAIVASRAGLLEPV